MKNDKSLLMAKIIVAIALIVSAATNLYNLNISSDELDVFVASYSLIATALFGSYYLISGCKKSESVAYYRIYMVLFAISQIATVFNTNDLYRIITSAIGAILLLILAFGKDLGKKNTLIIVTILLIDIVVKLIGSYLNGNFDSNLFIFITLAFATYIIVLAKYEDKAKRNSK